MYKGHLNSEEEKSSKEYKKLITINPDDKIMLNNCLTHSKKISIQNSSNYKSTNNLKFVPGKKNGSENNASNQKTGKGNSKSEHMQTQTFDLLIPKQIRFEEFNFKKSEPRIKKMNLKTLFKSLRNSPDLRRPNLNKKETNKRKKILKSRFKRNHQKEIFKVNKFCKRRFKQKICKFSMIGNCKKEEAQVLNTSTAAFGFPEASIQENETTIWKSPKAEMKNWQDTFLKFENSRREPNEKNGEFTRNLVRFESSNLIEENLKKLHEKSNFDLDKTFFIYSRNFNQPKRKVSFSKYKQKFSLTRKVPRSGDPNFDDLDDLEKKHFQNIAKKQNEFQNFLKKQLLLFESVN